jgi:hypothetical protein
VGGAALIDEIWSDIPGWEGYYQTSNLGRVKSCDRYVEHLRIGKQFVKGRVLKHGCDRYGYSYVTLSRDGVQKNCSVHGLVMIAFIGDRPEGYEINHLDRNKRNNCLMNLEYCTRSQNIQHAYDRPIKIKEMSAVSPRTPISIIDQI